MITHHYTFLCDDFRIEINGKFIIIGLYPNGLGTPQIPFPLPNLTFFQSFSTDVPCDLKFKATLSQFDNGTVLATVTGAVQAATAGGIVLPIKLPNLKFMQFGTYAWSLEIEGQDGPFLTEFSVMHVPPNARLVNPMPGR